MASKRGVRRRQCGNKAKMTKKEAMDRATGMSRFKKDQSYDAYPCGLCGGGVWHIGHRPAHVQKAITTRRRSH